MKERVQMTASEICNDLGEELYNYLICKYDKKMEQREKTGEIKKNFKGKRCAGCGKRDTKKYQLDAAHISPLSECEDTIESNLILLCREKKEVRPLGCHTLFDRGYCSINEIREARSRWEKDKRPELRSLLNRQLTKLGTREQQQGHLKNEVDQLRKIQDELKQDNRKEWVQKQIQIAEIERRRTKKDALNTAEKELNKIAIDQITGSAWRSRYYYENGYIALLKGRPGEALAAFNSEKSKISGWRWTAHTVMAIQAQLVLNPLPMNDAAWLKIQKVLSKALLEAKRDLRQLRLRRKLEEIRHAERWVQNCLLQLVKPTIALHKYGDAKKFWNLASKNWERMDLSSGWEAAFRPAQLFLQGKLLLDRDQGKHGADKALPYLVRALVRMVGLKHQQPENSRDLLCAIAVGLKRKNDPYYIEVKEVAERCIDYSSWFEPSPVPK